ncbi:hypothetical protein HY837_00510 [archaeon]|nr:hypothetical protein [archaeon]
MACHLTYINQNNGIVIFDMFGYMGNMGVNMNDFDNKTKTRLEELGTLLKGGIKEGNLADYLSGIAETIQYVEAAQIAKGNHLDHTHTIDSVVQDIVNSKYGALLGLREEEHEHDHYHTHEGGHEHHHTHE